MVGPNALEQLSEDVIRLARSYVHASPTPIFSELVRVRNRAYRLLDRTRQPGQRSDLYLMAGQTCGLLASASFDLGYPHPAAEQARAARAYGEVIGHDELIAWADGMLACIEFWSGRPGHALHVVARGLDKAPAGTPRIRLLSIGARAAALTGDATRTQQGIHDAYTEREHAIEDHEMHDRIGGEFGFDPARQAFCNGTAYLTIGDAGQAQTQCAMALDLYQAAPAERRWYAAEASAHTDLAKAHLMLGDVSGATDALTPLFDLAPDRRVEGVIKRLSDLRLLLAKDPSPDARALGEQIENFTVENATKALPAS